MSLKRELKQALKERGLSLSDLNKKGRQADKQQILDRLIRDGLSRKQAKVPLFKDLRKLGLKFSNEVARESYNKQDIGSTGRRQGAAKLRRDYKPRVTEKLSSKSRDRVGDGNYLYVATVYTYDGKKKNLKKIPKKSIAITRLDRFNGQSEIGFRSKRRLTREEIDANFLALFEEQDFDNSELTGSDYNHIFSSVSYTPIAFKYKRVLSGDN